VLDATKQPGFSGTPILELNGASAGASENGFTLFDADNSVIRGWCINRYTRHGIGLSLGTSNCVIAGNYLGTNAAGTADLGNGYQGVALETDAANNIIGGTTAADRNVISGNDLAGVAVAHIGATGNTITGNYIGTNAAGTAAIANTFDGVFIRSNASGNTVGGTASGSGNLISGNTRSGVALDAAGNTVIGNVIGLNAAGTAAVGNVATLRKASACKPAVTEASYSETTSAWRPMV
jgi:hypothetical protein